MVQVLQQKPRNPSKPLVQARATDTKQGAFLLGIPMRARQNDLYRPWSHGPPISQLLSAYVNTVLKS